MRPLLISLAVVVQLGMTESSIGAQERARQNSRQVLSLRHVDARLLTAPRINEPSKAMRPNNTPVPLPDASHRARNALVGGLIGSVAGVVLCTGISTLMNDSANSGFSTCTTKGNIAFGAGGFVVGALIGSAVR